jgi:hypothetical protein
MPGDKVELGRVCVKDGPIESQMRAAFLSLGRLTRPGGSIGDGLGVNFSLGATVERHGLSNAQSREKVGHHNCGL